MGFFKPKERPRNIDHLPQKGRAKMPTNLEIYYQKTWSIPEVVVYKEGVLPVFTKELGYDCTCILMPITQNAKKGEKQPMCQYALYTFCKSNGLFNSPQHYIEYGEDISPIQRPEIFHDPTGTAIFLVGERFNVKKGSPYTCYDDFSLSYRDYCYGGYYGTLEFLIDYANGLFTPGPYFGWGFHENKERCKELQEIFDHGKPNVEEWYPNAAQRRESYFNFDCNAENGEFYWKDKNGKYPHEYPDYVNRLEVERAKYRLEHAEEIKEYEDYLNS